MHPNLQKFFIGLTGALSIVTAQAQLPSPWREIVQALVAMSAAWWQAAPQTDAEGQGSNPPGGAGGLR